MCPDSTVPVPLDGTRVAVTRPERQNTGLGALLRAAGAMVLYFPTIRILPPVSWAPLDDALARLDGYDWLIVTSSNAVASIRARMAAARVSARALRSLRIAAVGSSTRGALEHLGIAVSAVPDRTTAAAIPDALGDVTGLRILLPRSDIASPELPKALRQRGACVDDIAAYRTTSADGVASLLGAVRANGVDVVTFASGSAVREFAAAASGDPDVRGWERWSQRPRIATIGPTTAAVARELNVPVDAVAESADPAGVVRAVVRCVAGSCVQ